MGTGSSRPQSGRTADLKETPLASRKRQMRSWLILGAGAIGVASAVAKWAMQARQGASAVSAGSTALRKGQTTDLTSQSEGTGTPVPLVVQMPESAAPTNDSRTALVEPESVPEAISNQEVNSPPSAASPSTPKKARTGKTANSATATPDMITPPAIAQTAAASAATTATTNKAASNKTTSGSSRKRGKMSEEYDQALQANTLPTGGREGSRLNHEMEGNSMTVNDSANVSPTPGNTAQAGSAGPAPSSAPGGAAEQALSTQAEGKMAVGEELRDREFPVPPQASGADSQKLVVDQETMHDGGMREGGAIGTMHGDHQNKGEVGDIEDQAAKTPDFAQQR